MKQFFILALYVLSILFSSSFAVALKIKGENTNLLRSYLVMQWMIIIWIFGKIMVIIAPDIQLTWFFTIVQYIGVCFFCVAFFNFTYYYCKGYKLKEFVQFILVGIGMTNYLFLITNNTHHLFFAEFEMGYKSYGPVFYAHTLFSYSIITLGYYFLLQGLYSNNSSMEKNKKIWITIGLCLPIALNYLHVFVLRGAVLDLTPVMFNLTLFVFGYLSYKYKFLGIKKIANYTLFENLKEGIIITDSNKKIVRYNKIISEYVKLFQIDLQKLVKEMDIDLGKEVEYSSHSNKYCFFIQGERILKGVVTKFYVIRITDISKYKKALALLNTTNEELKYINSELSKEIEIEKKLAVAKERSRVSKELHDIIGHSLTLIISLLETSKSLVGINREQAAIRLASTKEIIRDGYAELKKALSGTQEEKIYADALVAEIEKMGSEMSSLGTQVEVLARHSSEEINQGHYEAVFRMCQESMTNAVRHGKAKNIVIALRFSEEELDMIIADDGRGCKKLIKGNGLIGMEERVKQLKGSFSCNSPNGEGFHLHIVIPLISLA